ncbi:hypothetical protein [Corynebacterium glutamicum]|uniref:hypothetical protein n=1 Tax=Corynebacterium glutamicum TaxID=1718 RepID=UPI001466B19E|nr:hypothetical protein [Corynebacterium glutamicum]GFK19263.1 hypothetical protein KbCgl_18350 [Corynebacterium glutamicum]
MDIKYFTLYLAVGKFRLQIPTGQRNGDAEWINLPEGIHQVQITNDLALNVTLRYKTPTATATESRTILGVIPTSTGMGTVVVPPGGGQIALWQVGTVTEATIAPPAIIHAGVTVFLGTNEPPA